MLRMRLQQLLRWRGGGWNPRPTPPGEEALRSYVSWTRAPRSFDRETSAFGLHPWPSGLQAHAAENYGRPEGLIAQHGRCSLWPASSRGAGPTEVCESQ